MKKISLLIVVLLALGFIGYKYVYHSHKDISNASSDFSLTVNQMVSEFTSNENEANKKYLDKVISIQGKVSQVDLATKTMVIDNKATLIFSDIPKVKVGDNVHVKGRFLGYDELLEELKLDQCSLEN